MIITAGFLIGATSLKNKVKESVSEEEVGRAAPSRLSEEQTSDSVRESKTRPSGLVFLQESVFSWRNSRTDSKLHRQNWRNVSASRDFNYMSNKIKQMVTWSSSSTICNIIKKKKKKNCFTKATINQTWVGPQIRNWIKVYLKSERLKSASQFILPS